VTKGVAVNTFLARLADVAYRRRGRMVGAWLIAAVVVIGLGSSFADEFRAEYSTPGSESKDAQDLTEREFAGFTGEELFVVWRDPAGADRAEVREHVDAVLAEAKTIDYVGDETPVRVSDDGTIATTTLPLSADQSDFEPEDGEGVIAAAERESVDGLDIKVGGQPIYLAQEGSSPEGIGFMGAAIVLLIAFGSVVAAGLPLVVALMGLGVSSGGLILLLTNVIDVPDWSLAVAGLIGIGVGIDYSLLVITRFRAAMAHGKDRHDALVEAITTGGRSVIVAGATVVIAMLGLVLTGLPYIYGVAVAASLAVLVVMVAAITLLPALLAFLGPRVDRLRLPGLGRSLRSEGDAGSVAARWSHFVQRRPWPAVVAGGAVLLALSAPALGMRLGFPDAGNDGSGTMTRQAYDMISTGFGPGANGPLVIASELPSPAAVGELEQLADEIRTDDGVAFVSPPIPSESGNAAMLNVIPKTAPQDDATTDLVHRIRETTIPAALDDAGMTAMVGGVTASVEDHSEFVQNRMPLFITGVVGLSFLLLLVAFRSPLVSLKAAVMNLLSVTAAYGVMTVFAQGGAASELIGLDHEVPIAPFMPVMMFAILFGLSMDYEVFLISRIREEYLRHGDTRRAVADGLAKTARVITAAAAIMVVVFLAFLAAQDVFLKLFGIGLAAAVLLDATVVRMVLVPAVMQLLGHRNWWIPKWLERALPRLEIEPGGVRPAESRT
jgi:RND superfamily putative drug exporter